MTSQPTMSEEWSNEVQRRSAEIDASTVVSEDWMTLRKQLFSEYGVPDR